MSVEDDVLTFVEAQAFLKLGRSALYRLVGRNHVPHRRVGKQIRFSRAALLAWLEGSSGSRLTAPPTSR